MMKRIALIVMAALLGFLALRTVQNQVVNAQQLQDRLAHLEQLAELGRSLEERLPEGGKYRLSSGGQQLIFLGKRFENLKRALELEGVPGGRPDLKAPPIALRPRPGSDPTAPEDFTSRLGGMTQSETTVAWCGKNAVIGFNDSGSFAATVFGGISPSGSFSFNGWSRSTNRGRRFTDLGTLLADPLPGGVTFRDLGGDPLVSCTDSSTFYYGSLATDTTPGPTFSGISVSQSTNGGASWGGAVMAASKDASDHFLDKPWMAVEPGPTAASGDDIIHVTYTDIDTSGDPPCGPDPQTAIEYVRSTDGGATWSPPIIIDLVCGPLPFVQASQVEVGLSDDVYVAWENYAGDFVTRDIKIRKSTDAGDPTVGVPTFGGPVVVAPVTPVGDAFVLQGIFRSFMDLQGLAVDRSTGPNSGNVYIAWHDGSNLIVPDPLAGTGPGPGCTGGPTYCFADILFSRSTDGGATWSPSARVNNNPIAQPTDQFMPAMDVDPKGRIYIFYYDRRLDSRNFLIGASLARSKNGGTTWRNRRIINRRKTFAPVTGWEDIFVTNLYMGDYIAATADSTGAKRGVIMAWGDNSLGDPNILHEKKR